MSTSAPTSVSTKKPAREHTHRGANRDSPASSRPTLSFPAVDDRHKSRQVVESNVLRQPISRVLEPNVRAASSMAAAAPREFKPTPPAAAASVQTLESGGVRRQVKKNDVTGKYEILRPVAPMASKSTAAAAPAATRALTPDTNHQIFTVGMSSFPELHNARLALHPAVLGGPSKEKRGIIMQGGKGVGEIDKAIQEEKEMSKYKAKVQSSSRWKKVNYVASAAGMAATVTGAGAPVGQAFSAVGAGAKMMSGVREEQAGRELVEKRAVSPTGTGRAIGKLREISGDRTQTTAVAGLFAGPVGNYAAGKMHDNYHASRREAYEAKLAKGVFKKIDNGSLPSIEE